MVVVYYYLNINLVFSTIDCYFNLTQNNNIMIQNSDYCLICICNYIYCSQCTIIVLLVSCYNITTFCL